MLTFTEWQDTGKFTNRIDFEKTHKNEKIHPDCTDVIEYQGNQYIQSLKTGLFFINSNQTSKNLVELEEYIWYKVINNKDVDKL